MAGISSVMSLLGTAVSAAGTLAAGRAQQRQADYQAARDEVKAGEAKALRQRDARKIDRERRLALSRLQTLAAASGYTAGDPTSLKLAGETDAYGTYRRQLAQYGGDTQAADLNRSAIASRMRGEDAMTQARYGAAKTIIGGAKSLFRRYG